MSVALFMKGGGPTVTIKFVTNRLKLYPDLDRRLPGQGGDMFETVRTVMVNVLWDLLAYPDRLYTMCYMGDSALLIFCICGDARRKWRASQ